MSRFTAQGLVPTTLLEWQDAFRTAFRAALGEDLALEPETVQGQLIGELAAAMAQQDEVQVSVAQGLSVYTARGRQLDNLGTLRANPRKQPARSTVTLTLGGSAGTTIPAGALVRDELGQQWRTSAALTLAGAEGMVAAEAVEFGPLAAEPATITTIVNPVTGWASVTNAAAAAPGRLIETDAAYRLRLITQTEFPYNSTLDAVAARVGGVEGVVRVKALSNDTGVAEALTEGEKKGLNLPPHSLMVIVQGGENDAIAAAIRATKAPGIPTAGGASGTAGGTVYRFQRVRPVRTKIEFTIETTTLSGGTARIRDALVAWFANLDLGQAIDPFRVFEAINSVPGFTIVSAPTYKDAMDAALDVTAPDGDQVFTLDADDVTIRIS